MDGDRMVYEDLVAEQKRIEEEACLEGVRRATRAFDKAKDKGRETSSAPGAAMVRRVVLPMAELLAADFAKRGRGQATGGGPLLASIRMIPPQTLCLAAARAALNGMSEAVPLAAICRNIGDALEDELRWYRWHDLNPAQAAAVRRRVAQSPSPSQRHAALAGFARRFQERAVSTAWNSRHLLGVGLKFVDYLVRLGVLEKIKMDVRKVATKAMGQAWAVRLTPEATEWYKEIAEFIMVSRPLSWPLVIPPVPWVAPYGGGFHFREGLDHPAIPRALKPLPLVRHASNAQREMLAKADLAQVYEGINALQATAWRINPRVYSVLTRLVGEGRSVPGLTAYEPKEIPERLTDEEAKDRKRLRARNNAVRIAHTENKRMVSKRKAQHRIFTVARKFVTYPQIYFAYNLDTRGRVYSCSDDISPQGNDLQRGLLEFANGEPLTDDGRDWLLIHLANCWGVDKVSYADRIRWAVDNLPMIRRIAEDPLEHREWFNADEKSVWQFLAACFAWADYEEHGPASVCRVPVMRDGSCSGIQHYSALMRDAATAPKVNLVPQDKPGDLYADVAQQVMADLATAPLTFPPRKVLISEKGVEPREFAMVTRRTFAREWHAWGIGRKEVKRPVMVLPYGGTFLATLKYTRKAVLKRMEEEGRPAWLPEADTPADKAVVREALVALSQFIWEAMKVKVTKPMEGMAHVQSYVKAWASKCPKEKFHWTAPSGFPVVTDYLKDPKSSVDVRGLIDGDAVVFHHWEPTRAVDWSQVTTAAAPNFVHSLDASHLLASLGEASRAGMRNLAAVHDAFGTTPSRTTEFGHILQDAFATMYSTDPFECLRDAAREHGLEVPVAPARGTLNVEDIRHADYLFA